MNSSFQEIGSGMKPEEVISVGKHWLWMTVFSICLFTSCGETNRHAPESTSPESKAQAVPARYDREVISTEEVKGTDELDPNRFEEFPDSDDFDLERFEDDDTQPDEFEDIRELDPGDEGREVQMRLE